MGQIAPIVCIWWLACGLATILVLLQASAKRVSEVDRRCARVDRAADGTRRRRTGMG